MAQALDNIRVNEKGGKMKKRTRRSTRAILALVALVAFGGCAVSVNPVTGKRGMYAYSWQQEISLGAETDAAIGREYGLYEDAALTSYVRSVGESVLAQSHLRRPEAREEFRKTVFTFRVLDSPVVNAFAVPGGYVYVTRGLLAYAENEAQLAVVLGHEIGHVAARHSSRSAVKSVWSQLGIAGAAIVAENVLGAGSGQTVMDLGSQATSLILLKYSRDDEREADRLGVEYSAMAGYRAGEARSFFHSLTRMSEQSGGRIPTFMSTHPDPGDRENTIVRLAAEWAAQGYATNKVGRDTLFDHIDGMILGQNPRQGFTDGGVFYHPDLRFQFPVPNSWRTVNDAAQVVLVAPDQNANIQVSIVPGATTASAAAASFLSQDGVTATGNTAVTVNGLPARDVRAEVTVSGTVLSVVAHFIEYNGKVYAFVGLTPKALAATYEASFLNTMRGFRALTNPTILGVKPFRLKTVVASRTGTFSSFLPAAMPPGFTANDAAIMNQVELTDTIQRGTRLKLWEQR